MLTDSVRLSYRMDLLVADAVVVETKAVESLAKIHEAQLITYLRLGGWTVGLLINSMSMFEERHSSQGLKFN